MRFNFYPSLIIVHGHKFPTVEHAYQACKTVDPLEKVFIRNAPTPGKAKQRGNLVTLVIDWEERKDGVMYQLVRQKFEIPSLKKLLLKTGTRYLIEGNAWNDTYWGQCPLGTGKNKLGIILMKVRSELSRLG